MFYCFTCYDKEYKRERASGGGRREGKRRKEIERGRERLHKLYSKRECSSQNLHQKDKKGRISFISKITNNI